MLKFVNPFTNKKVEVNPKKYSSEILEIHNEFEVAGEELLAEANKILEETPKSNLEKGKRLAALGFKQTPQAVESKNLSTKIEMSEQMIKKIKHYNFNYPSNKFITREQVKAICHKYNLVCGSVDRYKGFVPEVNLKQIENFKLKKEDQLDDIVVFIEETGVIENLDKTKIINHEKMDWLIERYVLQHEYAYISGSGSQYTTYPLWTKLVHKRTCIDHKFVTQLEEQHTLQICAPIKDMDIRGLDLADGYKLFTKHIPDPIVLQPVSDGYLIITAWGDESRDEIVQNPRNN